MKRLKTQIALALMLMLPLTLCAQVLKTGMLRAGAAKADITPIVEFYTGETATYSGVHDSVFVRTIVLDNGISKAAFVAIELSNVPGGDDLVNAVAAELSVKPENIIMTATHDHNSVRIGDILSPTLSDNEKKYYTYIKSSVLQAVREANKKLQPARIGYGTGKAYVNTNRDQKLGEGYHMGYNPQGPSDKTVAVVSFTNLTGGLIALYANYPVHAVVMYRAKTKNGKPEITGDLPGATSRYVEKHFKGAVALWTSGAAGDQNPLFMANYNQDGHDVYDEGVAGYAILDVLSRRLGEEIVRVTQSIQNTTPEVKLWGKKTSVTVPGRKREFPPEPGAPTQGYLAPGYISMIEGDPVTVPLHLFMINDIALAGVSGEVFSELGQHMKEQSMFDRTIVVTIMPKGAGYIPTDAAYLMPSEKAQINRIKPGYVEPAILKAFRETMSEYLASGKPVQ